MFMTRAITAALALAVFLAALFYLPQPAWAFFLLVVLAIGSWEWGALASFRGAARVAYSAFIVASALILYYVFGDAAEGRRVDTVAYAVSCVFWLTVAPLWLVQRWTTRNPLLFVVAGWIALVPMWLALVRLQADPWALLTILSVVWIADTAAYLAGKTWGRNKLAPAISPGKSWEGVWSGMAGALLVAAAWLAIDNVAKLGDESFYTIVANRFGYAGLALVVVFLVAMSVVGDLFESLVKRSAGAKDSSALLPGHGGILDRVDGLLPVFPIALALVML